jgi:hypothetical protein
VASAAVRPLDEVRRPQQDEIDRLEPPIDDAIWLRLPPWSAPRQGEADRSCVRSTAMSSLDTSASSDRNSSTAPALRKYDAKERSSIDAGGYRRHRSSMTTALTVRVEGLGGVSDRADVALPWRISGGGVSYGTIRAMVVSRSRPVRLLPFSDGSQMLAETRLDVGDANLTHDQSWS